MCGWCGVLFGWVNGRVRYGVAWLSWVNGRVWMTCFLFLALVISDFEVFIDCWVA